jgi:hypothetical protein
LIDKYLLTPAEIATLTDWQIQELYYHKRDKDGSLKIPEGDAPDREDTEEESIKGLNAVRFMMKPEDYEEGVLKIKEKFKRLREEQQGYVLHER